MVRVLNLALVAVLLSIVSGCSDDNMPPIRLVEIKPQQITRSEERITIDLGRVWFARATISPDRNNQGRTIIVRLRESASLTPIPSKGPEPIGVRFLEGRIWLGTSNQTVVLRKTRNRSDRRLTARDVGAVMPFRYVDIIGWQGAYTPESIKISSIASSLAIVGGCNFQMAHAQKH